MRNLLTEVSKMKNMMGLEEAAKPKYSPEVKSLIELLKDNHYKINWKLFSENPSIFTLDYNQMRINFQDLEEEIIKEVMKPRRIFRNLELYGYDIDDMFD